MSPEIALLFRAVLLGLLVLTVEQFSKRRRARQGREARAVADRVVVRRSAATPAAQTVSEPEFQYVRAVAARSERPPYGPRSVSARVIERRSVGAYVTEKRALTSSEETYSLVAASWPETIGVDEIRSAEVNVRAEGAAVKSKQGERSQNPHTYETA